MVDTENSAWFRGKLVLIPGAQKAGSTTLHAVLSAHPACHGLAVKEPQYLALIDEDRARHAGWYRSLFAPGQWLHVDASTAYLYHPDAAERARSLDPGVRAVILIRDPARRALSGYRHFVRPVVRAETRSFHDLLGDIERRAKEMSLWDAEEASIKEAARRGLVELSRLGEGFLERTVGGPFPSRFGDPLWGFRYLGLSEYRRFVPAWQAALPGAVLVASLEELVRRPEVVLSRIGEFLGIDPAAFPEALPVENPTFVPRGPFGRLAMRFARETRLGRGASGALRRVGLGAVVHRLSAASQQPAAFDAEGYERARRLLAFEYEYWFDRMPVLAELWRRPG